jgi:hypothetical protein
MTTDVHAGRLFRHAQNSPANDETATVQDRLASVVLPSQVTVYLDPLWSCTVACYCIGYWRLHQLLLVTSGSVALVDSDELMSRCGLYFRQLITSRL